MTDQQYGEYRLKEPDQSLGDLVGRLTKEVGDLVNSHMQLARVEITEEVKTAGRGAGLLGGGALAGWMAALFLSLAAGWGLAEAMDPWLAFLIVGAVWAVMAAILAVVGKKRLDQVEPPRQTMEELERDKLWMKEQRS